MDGELLRNNKMTERKQRLNQVAEKFGSDIIYAFGSHAKEVAEWLKGERSGLSISSLSGEKEYIAWMKWMNMKRMNMSFTF